MSIAQDCRRLWLGAPSAAGRKAVNLVMVKMAGSSRDGGSTRRRRDSTMT